MRRGAMNDKKIRLKDLKNYVICLKLKERPHLNIRLDLKRKENLRKARKEVEQLDAHRRLDLKR